MGFNNYFGGGNYLWIILILIILFGCGGLGCANAYGNNHCECGGCGC